MKPTTDLNQLPAEQAPLRRAAINRQPAFLRSRTGFWRSLIEMTLLIIGVVLCYYPFHQWIVSPWSELISYLSLSLYALAAWRLAPGVGGLARRAGRVLLWLLLFGLINGVLGWLIVTYLPWKSRFFGAEISESVLSPHLAILSTTLIIASLFLPTRLLLTVWAMGRQRLRWQLTFSYLLIGILTNFLVPLALVAYLAIVSLSVAPPTFPPGELAPRLAGVLAPALRTGATPAELNRLLAGLLDGSTRLPLAEGEELASFSDLAGGGVRRISLIGPDGQVLASAGAAALAQGRPLEATEAGQLRLVLDQAAAKGGCVNGHPASGPLEDTAVCAISAADGAPIALLLLESDVNSLAQISAGLGRVIAVTLIGFNLTLNIAILVIMAIVPIALGVGYLLARRLTRRIERLTAATVDLAAGDLSRRVSSDAQDEIGRLSANFNTMAAQLEEREHALGAAAAQAEGLLRANRRLVADVSHELRNPLATLRGYLEALEQAYGAQLPAHDLAVIRGETQRLTNLVDDLFTLARAEARQLPLNLEPVDVVALINRLVATLTPLAQRERQIEVVAQIAAELPLAQADQNRLEQVLRNLAQNALRYTPPGGILAFAAATGEDGSLQLTVADTGLGIAAEDLPHIFDRFYRGDSSRARETGGAGLGLALVHELVSAMGGAVMVESTLGRGSRFTVQLRRA